MSTWNMFVDFINEQSDKLLEQTWEHVGLTLASLLCAVLIGLPLGILIARYRKWASSVLGISGVLQTIPSIALLGFMIPLLGIGIKPAIFALLLYALLPIIRNTYTGITQVDPTLVEAARGMGMTSAQVLKQVQLPLAMPVIWAGIRTAAVINIGVATLASYIGAGGLGEFIFGGIALNNAAMILAGAIPAALLALLFDFLLSRLQKRKQGSLKSIGLALVVTMVIVGSGFISAANQNKFLAGFTPEFMGRQDCYPGLKEAYQFKINTVVVGPALLYEAIREEKVDVISGYSTDGRIKAYQLTVLEDDQHFFPPYFAAPLLRTGLLQEYPEIETTLDKLAGLISDEAMTEMNYKVDHLKQSPKEVAQEFLVEKNLYRAPQKSTDGKLITLGSKMFSEQFILNEIIAQMIKGYTDIEVETKNGLGGTKICFDALTAGEIDLYPEYTGTGLMVLLQASPATVKEVTKNNQKVFDYVKEALMEQHGMTLLSPFGFNNTYALMMKQTVAGEKNIQRISDLVVYQTTN